MAIDGIPGGSNTPYIPPNDPPGNPTPPVGGSSNSDSPTPVTPVGIPPVGSSPSAPPIIPPQVLSPPKTAATPLDRPKLLLPSDTSNLSVGDLIELIQDEIHKTTDALADIQKAQIHQDTLKQQNANKAQIDALNSAASQIEEANKERAAMADVGWAMLAISLVFTIFSAGMLGPILLPAAIAVDVLNVVPVGGQTLMGWVTTGIGDALGDIEKDAEKNIKDSGGNISDDKLKSDAKSIEDSQGYQAMAVMTTLQVAMTIVSIVVSIASFGTAAPGALSADAEFVAESSLEETVEITDEVLQEASEEVSQEVENTVEQSVQTAQRTAQQIQKAQKTFDLVKNAVQLAPQLATDALNIHVAYLEYENSSNQADADKVKAYTKFLQQILNSEEDFLKQIIESQSNIADTVKDILQTEHSTNMHIANLTNHA